MSKKTFIITGGNFVNKGAQSMLFVTISELRSRFRDCNIFVVTDDKIEADVDFEFGSIHYDAWSCCAGGLGAVKAQAESIVKFCLGKKKSYRSISRLKEVLRKSDALIDISGYCLSSQWPEKPQLKYINRIKSANRFGVPVFLMPQSFGPFNYVKKQEKMDKLIRENLAKAEHIFVREQDGYQSLTEVYGLDNVELSADLVLQNKLTELDYVYKSVPAVQKFNLDTIGNVAILPNIRNFDHDAENQIMDTYLRLIEIITSLGKTVYLTHHSDEDLKACTDIYDRVSSKKNVVLVERDFQCYEYSEFVKNFDYVIASRYHSIVHAYKAGVPAIVIGWAIKYHELLKQFEQTEYMFDIRERIDFAMLEKAIRKMENEHGLESKKIIDRLTEIQCNNCFEVISDYFKK